MKHDASSALRRTVDWSELESWQLDNAGIRTGYRRLTYSWFGCLSTLSWWHNETVNIWSHLLGAIGVVGVSTLLFQSKYPHESNNLSEFALLGVSWPLTGPSGATSSDTTLLMVFLAGAFVCFLCSALFHSSTCHSEPVVRYMNRVDYFGILALGTVNYFPTFHYAFFCAPALRNLYIALMTISGSTGIYLACSPTYATPQYRRMRTYTFFACGGVVLVPFIHAVWRSGLQEADNAISLRWILAEAGFYVGGALLYSERFPECRWPGRFDLIGSSHQIFHICSLLAVWAHYQSVAASFRYWHVFRGGVCSS
ncbi:hemolysin-III related-domain-containing protein [Mycena amicta]|nr:hemolysin-III related-domain-containing protein [Mycena amicta]